MKRKERTEILIEGNKELRERIASQIEKSSEVDIVQPSEQVLAMIRMRENSKRAIFNLGEVLVTRTVVKVNNQFGTGIIVGQNPQASYELALIDAAFTSGWNETKQWMKWLKEEKEKITERKKEKAARILQTKVNFSTMEE